MHHRSSLSLHSTMMHSSPDRWTLREVCTLFVKDLWGYDDVCGYYYDKPAPKSLYRHISLNLQTLSASACRLAYLYLDVNLDNFHSTTQPFITYRFDWAVYCVPEQVRRAFLRHLWYSRYNLTDIVVWYCRFQFQQTFIIFLDGHVNDGWDNGCDFLELYDSAGAFLGAGSVHNDSKHKKTYIEWKDKSIKGWAYHTSAPPWPCDPPEDPYFVQSQYPFWSLTSAEIDQILAETPAIQLLLPLV